MGDSSGGPVQYVTGVGTKTSSESTKTELVTETYFTFFNHVVAAFELYPICEHFGIGIDDAMNMSVDRWYRIRKAAARLAEKKLEEKKQEKPDTTELLVQLIKELRGGGE